MFSSRKLLFTLISSAVLLNACSDATTPSSASATATPAPAAAAPAPVAAAAPVPSFRRRMCPFTLPVCVVDTPLMSL